MRYLIDKVNWEAFNSDVKAEVDVVCTADAIQLKYSVEESAVLAQNRVINSPVYQDSCVEFFVLFNRKEYYNIECNAIGTLLVQYGNSRKGRLVLAPELISTIEVVSSLGREPFNLRNGAVEWSVEMTIPKTLFCFSDITNLNTQKMWGNFYKCGDNLPEKHYFSAFEIGTKKPDFHRPDFFKRISS